MTEHKPRPFRTELPNGAVSFPIAPDGPCPCASGRPTHGCCLCGGILEAHAASTVPAGPKTGTRVPGCYAAHLLDCAGVLSREHFVSRTVLDHLNQASTRHGTSSESMEVEGLHWLPQRVRIRVGLNSLVSRILCERHNAALTGLDDSAGKLFRTLDAVSADLPGARRPTTGLLLLSGHDVEKWMLKVLCGIAASGNMVISGQRSSTDVPVSWSAALFSDDQLPLNWGLYVPRHTMPRTQFVRGVATAGVGWGEALCGFEVSFNEFVFFLLLAPRPNGERKFGGIEYVYRPKELHVSGEDWEYSVAFGWQGAADNGTLHYR
jgi:hypothetical protein